MDLNTRSGDVFTASASQNADASRTGRIPREDWPEILHRYEDGETQTEIARDYGVTPAAISYAVKRARAQADDTHTDIEAAPMSSTLSGEATPSETIASDSEQSSSAPNEAYQSAGARRLAEASTRACQALEGLQKSRDVEAIKASIHDVRRALAAIEIDLAKGVPSCKPGVTNPSEQAVRADPAQLEDSIPARVKFFDRERGFGFVVLEGGGDDIYVNAKTLAHRGYDTLDPSQEVLVTIKAGRRGPEVADLELVE